MDHYADSNITTKQEIYIYKKIKDYPQAHKI